MTTTTQVEREERQAYNGLAAIRDAAIAKVAISAQLAVLLNLDTHKLNGVCRVHDFLCAIDHPLAIRD